MSRSRLISLSLLVAFVVGGVASASAVEPPTSCLKVTTTPAYCVAGVPLVSASEEVEGTNSGSSVLKATIGSVTSEIKCEKGKSKGTIEGGAAGTAGKSTSTMSFEKCKLLKPENCKLTSAEEKEIKTTELKGELVMTAGRVEDKLEPETGAAFAGISIEGKTSSCVIAEVGKPKTYNITGSQLCEVGSGNTEAETEAIGHKIKCNASGSSLNIGTSPAEMTSEATVKLTSGKNWSVKET